MEPVIISQLSNDSSLDSSCSDSDVSFDDIQSQLSLEGVSSGITRMPTEKKAVAERKRNGEERLPTRRPDPNVYNRNALMARENRRKKKMHLEIMEKELEETRNANRVLVKALRRQHKVSRRLEQEKQYFKSIVANRTEIVKLVSALNGRLSMPSPHPALPLNQGQLTPASTSSYDYEPSTLGFDTSDNDLKDGNWNDLLKEELPQPLLQDDVFHSISNEHSYGSPPDAASAFVVDCGVCLHVARGKVSLEYCPSCHVNALKSAPLLSLEYTD